MVFVHHAADKPGEVYLWEEGKPKPRAADLAQRPPASPTSTCRRPRASTFAGADGDKVHGWLIRPPGFDPKKKYPVVFLIHGGPQGAWHDEWHGRWNYQMFAAPGYAVVAINPRGSTGYGQKFTDQISQDWTGQGLRGPHEGPRLSPSRSIRSWTRPRVAAAGGSYGGFMVNWICGHTDRFKALISHAGVFDLASKYGTTEELWFPEWEFGGLPGRSPSTTASGRPAPTPGTSRRPTLVIHGALDFRVPDAQGLGMFTCAPAPGRPQPLRLVPRRGPLDRQAGQNRIVWWREVQEWLERYLK